VSRLRTHVRGIEQRVQTSSSQLGSYQHQLANASKILLTWSECWIDRGDL